MRRPHPLAPWELDYPHREELWEARYPLLKAYRGEAPLPAGETAEQVLARAQISGAYHVEFLARSVMAGQQFTGVQTHKRHVLVDQSSTAWDLRQIWDAGPRTLEVQAFVDRAVGCLRQVFAQGVVVLEWDKPGYDDVTRSFKELLVYASDPEVTPVVLEWDLVYHGEPPLPPDPTQTWVPPPQNPIWQRLDRAFTVAHRIGLGLSFALLGYALLPRETRHELHALFRRDPPGAELCRAARRAANGARGGEPGRHGGRPCGPGARARAAGLWRPARRGSAAA
jgi:hypothetical protein